MYAADWRAHRHFILYPNPHPKRNDIKNRLYGNPVLPVLLALGGDLEIRANWEEYLTDFAAAARAIAPYAVVSGPNTLVVEDHQNAMTAFEMKYTALSLPVYKVNIKL
jgi:tRNA (guanine-N7-)-methyltransferase